MPFIQCSRMRTMLLLIAVTWSSVACAGRGDPDIAAGPLVIDTVLVERESPRLAELEQRVARLQLQLLEREAQIEQLQRSRDAAVEEVLRVSARLQTSASRAEAASVIAEAEIAVNELRGVDAAAPEIDEATRMIQQAATAFDAGNFSGALYAGSEARRLAQTALVRRSSGVERDLQPGEAWFTTPLRLETLRRSNLREGPGLNRPILFTLDPGTPLTGLSYTDQWVRVRDETGRTGWIFHSLVGHRAGGRPN